MPAGRHIKAEHTISLGSRTNAHFSRATKTYGEGHGKEGHGKEAAQALAGPGYLALAHPTCAASRLCWRRTHGAPRAQSVVVIVVTWPFVARTRRFGVVGIPPREGRGWVQGVDTRLGLQGQGGHGRPRPLRRRGREP